MQDGSQVVGGYAAEDLTGPYATELVKSPGQLPPDGSILFFHLIHIMGYFLSGHLKHCMLNLHFNAFIIYYFLIFIYSALIAINVLKPLYFCQLNSIFFFINILLQELPLFLSSHPPKGPSLWLLPEWFMLTEHASKDLSSKYLTLSEGSRLDFICIWKQSIPVDSYLCGLLVNLLTHMTALAAQLQEGNTQPHPTPSAVQTVTIFPSAHTC